MSEQLSFSAGGGLLSLNLTTLPQGPSSLTPESAQALASFNALLAQQGSSSDFQAEGSGALLPPQGANLPQQELLVGDDAIRQQLLNLAQLLEQQENVDADGLVILPEVTRELSKALRDYAQQDDISVLPPEVQTALENQSNVTSGLANLAVESGPAAADGSSLAVEQSALPVAGQQNSDILSAATQNGSPLLTPEASLTPVSENTQTVANNPQAQGLSQQEAATQRTQFDTTAQSLNATQPITQAQGQTAEANVAAINAVGSTDRTLSDLVRRQGVSTSDAETTGAAVTADADDSAQSTSVRRVGEAVVVPQVPRTNTESLASQQQELPQVRVTSERAALADVVAATQTINTGIDDSPAPNSGIRLEQPLNLQSSDALSDDPQQLLQRSLSADRAAADAGSSLSQRLEAANATSQAVPQHVSQPTQVQKAVTEANNLLMPHQVKLNTPAWNNALGERAVLIATQNSRVAEIQLDPPELGSLNVRVQINQDQVSLSFTSPHAHVRDAVEQSLPRLREMFAEQGLALNESSVSDQQQNDRQREGVDERYAGDRQRGYGSGEQVDEGEQLRARTATVSLVDYYA